MVHYIWLQGRGRYFRVPYHSLSSLSANSKDEVRQGRCFYREVSYGSTENQISVPSVCEGSRLAELGDGRGFKEKFQIFISLMEFIAYFFHCVRRKSPQFLQKLSFDKNLAEKPNSSVFEMIYGFCSYLRFYDN